MKAIIVGNWKANENFEIISDLPKDCDNIEICLAVPHIYIPKLRDYNLSHISIAAQDCSATGIGPHTGETPAEFLKQNGVKYVIIGHSERRQSQNETSEELSRKIHQALSAGLKVIYCIGESGKDRDRNSYIKALYDQFFSVVGQNINIDISYEPLYSIGTGIIPSNKDIQEVVDYIKKWSSNINVTGRILYGGSLEPNSIETLQSIKNLDGFLVGAASLKKDFIDMIVTFNDMCYE